MEAKFPEFKPEYEFKITKEAYEKLVGDAQPLLDKALRIYEAYLNTRNEVLYDAYGDVLDSLYPRCQLLAVVAESDMNRLFKYLNNAAAFLADLSVCVRCDNG